MMKTIFKRINAAFVLKMLAIAFCISFAVILLWGGGDYLNSDFLSPDMIALELRESGLSAFKDFVSQAGFAPVSLLHWLPKLLLNSIIPNLFVVDVICAVIYYAVLLVLVYFTVKLVTGGEKIAIALIGCGISTSWMTASALESLYITYLIYMMIFLCLSCYLMKQVDKEWTKKERMILLVLALFVIYIISYDLRFSAAFIVPFCVATLVCCYIEFYSAKTLNELGKKPAKNYLILFLCILAALACGLLINTYLKFALPYYPGGASPTWYTFTDFSKLFEQIAIQMQSVLQLWGCYFRPSESSISLVSIGYLIKAVACACVMWIFPVLCVFEYKKLPVALKVLLISYWVLVAEMFYVYGLSIDNTVATSRYFTYEIILAIIISSCYIEEKLIKPYNLNRYIVVIAVLIFGMVSQAGLYKDIKGMKRSGLLNSRKQLVAQLEADGLSYGYATWWNAQILSNIADYDIEILPVILGQGISPHFSYNFIHRFLPENYSGDTFLLLTMEEYQSMQNGEINPFLYMGEPDRMYDAGEYVVCVYDHNIAEDSPYFPSGYYYTPINGSFDIGQKVPLEEDSCAFLSVGEANIYKIPVDIEPDSYYRVTFSMETASSPELFYMDFEGTPIESVNLEDMDPTARGITYESGQKNYEIIIPSGSTMDTSKDIYLRIVCTPTSGVAIKNIEMNVLELYNIN